MSAIQAPPACRPAQSTFVNVVAWISIVLSAFATCSGLFSLAIFIVFTTSEDVHQWYVNSPGVGAATISRLKYLPWFVGGHLVFTTTMFAASIGLLRRRNWGRWMYIGIMALFIAWFVAVLVVPQYVLGFSEPMPLVMRVVSIVMTAAICAVPLWIIRRLVSPAIVAEFRRP
ncbi:hypothetical protein [Noviluteimonas gilva]|uniref:Uncharacterized protein n=1 Tax=Noviluteimonas gilva TaxID=2682097 RepID=A0A7C9LH80_9GAMM|nr:hypothetical protein [Lysobacter gilvus]MUV14681.1 hypothetical protein [Lysobacter gilvus]